MRLCTRRQRSRVLFEILCLPVFTGKGITGLSFSPVLQGRTGKSWPAQRSPHPLESHLEEFRRNFMGRRAPTPQPAARRGLAGSWPAQLLGSDQQTLTCGPLPPGWGHPGLHRLADRRRHSGLRGSASLPLSLLVPPSSCRRSAEMPQMRGGQRERLQQAGLPQLPPVRRRLLHHHCAQ